MLLESEFPPDIRVKKECKTLIGAGHEIHLISRNRGRKPLEDEVYGIHIHRLPYLPKVFGRLNAWISVPHFANPVWLVKLFHTVGRYSIDILHVHNLPLMLTGLIVGRCYGVPVILDNHENFPEFLKAVGYRGIVLSALFNARFFGQIEKLCMKHAIAVICTAEEGVEFYSKAGLSEDKLVPLINAVDLDSFSSPAALPEAIDKYDAHFVLSYIGGIGTDRNLELVTRALPLLISKIHNVHLLLVGKNQGRTIDRLRELADSLGVSGYVTFVGEVPFEHVPAYMGLSQVGIVCHMPSLHTHTTTPHKLFQYMAMAKPVIVTDVRPLRRIVESENCGFVVHWDDPEEMAEAILRLYEDPEYARQVGANGQQAVREKYNWDKISEPLVDLYKMIGNLHN